MVEEVLKNTNLSIDLFMLRKLVSANLTIHPSCSARFIVNKPIQYSRVIHVYSEYMYLWNMVCQIYVQIAVKQTFYQ